MRGGVKHDHTLLWCYPELILPTERELSGDFSQSGMTIFDPLTTRRDPNNPSLFIRDPFLNNIIPASRINPVAREIAKF